MKIVIVSESTKSVIESGFASFAAAWARIAELGGDLYATYQSKPGKGVYNRVDGWQ